MLCCEGFSEDGRPILTKAWMDAPRILADPSPGGVWGGCRRQARGPSGGLIPGGVDPEEEREGEGLRGRRGRGPQGTGRGAEAGLRGRSGRRRTQEDPQGGNGSSPGGGGAESMLKWGPGLWGGFREVRPFHPPTPHPSTPATRAYRRCIFLWARSSLCLGASSCPAPLLWVSGLRGLWWPWLRRVWSGTLRPPPACGPHNFCSDEPGLWGCWGRWEGSLQAP